MRESIIYKRVAHIIDGGQCWFDTEIEARLFDISIDIVLTFEYCNDFMIRNMTIFNKVDYTEVEPALTKGDATKMI